MDAASANAATAVIIGAMIPAAATSIVAIINIRAMAAKTAPQARVKIIFGIFCTALSLFNFSGAVLYFAMGAGPVRMGILFYLLSAIVLGYLACRLLIPTRNNLPSPHSN